MRVFSISRTVLCPDCYQDITKTFNLKPSKKLFTPSNMTFFSCCCFFFLLRESRLMKPFLLGTEFDP